jgi:hypothetical protein
MGELDSMPDHKDLQLVILKELCDSMRARSEPEHLYTAAAVGSFGAVAWGVAALRPEQYLGRPFYLRPAAVAVMGILIVAVAICIKIKREHTVYADTKKALSKIAIQLASLEGAEGMIPDHMRGEKAGPGFKYSIGVVAAAASLAILFCLSVATIA